MKAIELEYYFQLNEVSEKLMEFLKEKDLIDEKGYLKNHSNKVLILNIADK